jgi:hypothetical protein
MISITITDTISELVKKLPQQFTKGLIVVSGHDFTWNEFLLTKLLHVLQDGYPGYREAPLDRLNLVRLEKEVDQYTWERLPVVMVKDLNGHNLVRGDSIRSAEQAQALITAAQVCPVVAVVHADSDQSVLERLRDDMGITEDLLKEMLVISVK